MPRFVIECAGQRPRLFELSAERPVKIGRATTNDLILSHASVSRRHAVISLNAEGLWQIADQGSANGVRVNGVAMASASLKSNDEIALGVYTLRFEEVESPQNLLTQAPNQLPQRLWKTMAEPAEVQLPLKPVQSEPPPGAERRTNHALRVQFLQRENRLLMLLYQVSRVLGDLSTVEEVTERVLEIALEIEGVERGYVMLLDEPARSRESAPGQYNFLPANIRYRRAPSERAPQVILSQSIIRQVMEGGMPLLVADARADARFIDSASLALSGMQSAMCAPLRSRDRLFGLLYVDNLSKSGMFTQDDLNVFAVIAAQAGLAIDGVRARTQVARQFLQLNALERFLSPDIARKIAAEAGNLRLGGETQKVTLLFADIRGFTTLSESVPPEEVVETLNEFFHTMTDVVFDHEGTLDKYLGDGLMALFGAPFAREQHAFDAVRTAIDMQIGLAELNRTSSRPALHMGIGINTGPVVVGYLGTERRMDYTAVGDAVNVAARLTASAAADQILVSAATHAEIAGQVPARPLAPMRVKGRTEPVLVYEILWQEYLDRHPGSGKEPALTNQNR